MDEQQEEDHDATRALSKNINIVEPGAYSVYAFPNGDITSVSTDPKDDEITCPYYPPLEEIQRPEGVRAISRSICVRSIT